MDEKRLTEIEARANAATPGPWICPPCAMDDGDGAWIESASGYPVCGMDESRLLTDGQFIALARTDVPDLLMEVRRLLIDNARLRIERDQLASTVEALEMELSDA